ncbi:MAG: hypothetical protein JKY54_04080 [Flavobacteriales bacterium]|nr:hypothetical protein [Flavobacteriales bacterium]
MDEAVLLKWKRSKFKAINALKKTLGIHRFKKMTVKFLKAGSGDSILIHTNGQSILVDGGDDTTHLFKQLDIIHNKGQVLDLEIITHQDEDHILGILKMLIEAKNGRFGTANKFIRKIFFNSPRKALDRPIPEDHEMQASYAKHHC